MRIVLFYHSLVSDWNHGNAHFLRGVVSELLLRGHDVTVYEPANGWSRSNLVAEHGEAPLDQFGDAYPGLKSVAYDLDLLNVDKALNGADLVLVHEWNDPALVVRIGLHRAAAGGFQLIFHDTHHRGVTDPESMARYDLSHYDGVLAFGEVLRRLYLANGWTKRAWTWHEAADTRVFRPIASDRRDGDLVWIGNWGDDERTAELHEFLLEPVRSLGLRARVHGVRYPDHAKRSLREAGIAYGGWLPNFDAPQLFARYAMTVHVPRRPYVRALPGIPTIRVFEALACGIPLICSPWDDAEDLFTPGKDYLVARNGADMKRQMRRVLDDPDFARQLAAHAHHTILSRHTCAHRADELFNIVAELRSEDMRRSQRAQRPQRRSETLISKS
ncbi:MAG TPA: glycosyltransferase [Tepidisphaeraceae bacterium]|nr:glycosyltransferase [Tepidisphaeraceae bacterium]